MVKSTSTLYVKFFNSDSSLVLTFFLVCLFVFAASLQKISSKNDQPFKAVLRTCNGAIHVQLPRSFTGPIKHRTSNGSYKFSKGVQERLRSVSSNCSFLGSWEDSGFVNYEQWEGFELDASTPNGSIKFSYYDEGAASFECKGRQFLWFKR